MQPLAHILPAAVASFVRDAPLSAGKIAFAWKTAVGAAIDRATLVSLRADGTVEVRATDQHWRREIRRSAPVILERLTAMLGDGTVKKIVVVHEPSRKR